MSRPSVTITVRPQGGRRGHRTMSDDERKALQADAVARSDGGQNIRQIARELGHGRETIRELLAAAGRSTRQAHDAKRQALQKKAVALYTAGATLTEIQDVLGRSREYHRTLLREAGVTMRRRGRRTTNPTGAQAATHAEAAGQHPSGAPEPQPKTVAARPAIGPGRQALHTAMAARYADGETIRDLAYRREPRTAPSTTAWSMKA